MPKILLVDDDPDCIEVYKSALSGTAYEIATANNGAEALAKVVAEKPDLVVLDVMMDTEYEGFDVARQIREELKLTDLPIIILSSIHDTKEVPYRFAPDETWLPVDLWLDKPIEPKAFLGQVKAALGETEQQPG